MAVSKKWLDSLEDDWKEQTSRQATGFTRHPDGLYISLLKSVELGESKAGKAQITWVYIFKDGDLIGKEQRDFDGLERDDAFYWLGIKLRNFGVDPASMRPRDLPGILEEISSQKKLVKLRLKSKGEYQNCYVEKVLPDDYLDDSDGPGARESDADETFVDDADYKMGRPYTMNMELAKGMTVKFDYKGTELVGVVSDIDEDESSASVRVGTKIREVMISELTVVEEGTVV